MRSTPSCACFMIRSASASLIGVGRSLVPRKPVTFGCVLDQMPGIVRQLHLHQHVAGEELALGIDLLAATHLDHLLGGHQHLVDMVGEALLLSLLLDGCAIFFSKPE